MFDWVMEPQAWIALLTLTSLEIVLGIDNIIFLSILVGRLPEHQRARARRFGLALAMITRIALLLSLAWVMTLVEPLFSVLTQEISGRDLILIGGGLFLLVKATMEISNSLEGPEEEISGKQVAAANFFSIIIQIAVIDIVFSLDSVITAVGMADHVPVMVLAIVLAVLVMMWMAQPIGDFVDTHPSIKILALSFLVMVGVLLIAEGFDTHVSKGYVYFAMAFSLCVEMLNIRMRGKSAPVKLHKQMSE
ncbi:MAG TPA: TerC family protein [Pseudomonadales bacterium]|nr:TerC family protein [Pseudomonadales bacterium]